MDKNNTTNSDTPVATPPLASSDAMRTLLAGQRTMLAWIRTGVALMGFGFLVAKFGLFLREIGAWSANPGPPRYHSTGVSLWMGMVLVLLGMTVNVIAAVRYRRFQRRFRTSDFGLPQDARFEMGLSLVLAAIGLVMAVYLVVVGR